MTKKHFQALAYALFQSRPPLGHTPETVALRRQWVVDVDHVSDACKAANPAFDAERFARACLADTYTPSMHGR